MTWTYSGLAILLAWMVGWDHLGRTWDIYFVIYFYIRTILFYILFKFNKNLFVLFYSDNDNDNDNDNDDVDGDAVKEEDYSR